MKRTLIVHYQRAVTKEARVLFIVLVLLSFLLVVTLSTATILLSVAVRAGMGLSVYENAIPIYRRVVLSAALAEVDPNGVWRSASRYRWAAG